MDEKTSITVRIYGNDYTFAGSESEEYIQRVCLYVDKKMRETGKASPAMPMVTNAILTAVNISDEFFKSKTLLEETLGDLKKYKEESFNLKNANNALKKENAFLKDEIQSLKIELAKNGKI